MAGMIAAAAAVVGVMPVPGSYSLQSWQLRSFEMAGVLAFQFLHACIVFNVTRVFCCMRPTLHTIHMFALHLQTLAHLLQPGLFIRVQHFLGTRLGTRPLHFVSATGLPCAQCH
jgi:hypothetical protein